MGFWLPAITSQRERGTSRVLVAVLLGIALAHGSLVPAPAEARIFTQEAVGYGFDGSPLPVTIINPESLHDLTAHTYALGSDRRLEIRTNLPSDRGTEIDSLAFVVQRCYDHLEAASGRTVPGGVLLYLLQYPQRPRCFRFQANTGDEDIWNEVRVTLLEIGQPLLGRGASRHVTEFIYDTLPHELTHSLLTSVPTIRHDLDGQDSQGTRWFIEGVCEKLAKDFAAQEAPEFWRDALRSRHVHRVFARPSLYLKVWQWGQASDLPWPDESDLYGVSMLLVAAWTEHIALDDLLALMARRGGDIHGVGLTNLVRETTPFGEGQLLAEARNLGHRFQPALDLTSR